MIHKLEPGNQIKFTNEFPYYNVMACNDRYAICTRKFDREHDYEFITHAVAMNAYSSEEAALDAMKDDTVYTIIDFDKNIRSPNDSIFNPYDYSVEQDCIKCLNDLISGECNLSRRNQTELLIESVIINPQSL